MVVRAGVSTQGLADTCNAKANCARSEDAVPWLKSSQRSLRPPTSATMPESCGIMPCDAI